MREDGRWRERRAAGGVGKSSLNQSKYTLIQGEEQDSVTTTTTGPALGSRPASGAACDWTASMGVGGGGKDQIVSVLCNNVVESAGARMASASGRGYGR